ncbi:MAG TPA: diguanylate cyclase [Bryobacteraceae bacterium]|nr:diguanylate cyclase [Bryobacteraceae bacterium]
MILFKGTDHIAARVYLVVVELLGAGALVWAAVRWECADPLRLLWYLVATLAASLLTVTLPGSNGPMSANFLTILMGMAELSRIEMTVVGCAAALAQTLWHGRSRTEWRQDLIHVLSKVAAVWLAYGVFHSPAVEWLDGRGLVRLVLTSAVYFSTHALSVTAAAALREGRPWRGLWHDAFFWVSPGCLAGAALAWVLSEPARGAGWQVSLEVLPVLYLIYRCYDMYLARLEREKRQVSAMAQLERRTIEALALAIEAKDHSPHGHLRRMEVFTVGLGRKLGLSEPELEALRAAALLHDVGKLAVSEHILSKPGVLTAEEFERVKIHPAVGAEILEQVQFPYPVAPLVRAHHERWDGKGYPDGLKGEAIPRGARILAAVDCLDALASERQYRRALPLGQAMREVAAQAGTAFDPEVVKTLQRHYLEWERQVGVAREPGRPPGLRAAPRHPPPATTPAGGKKGYLHEVEPSDFLASIAAARQEMQMLFELTQDLGNSLSVEETLSVLATRLKRMVPHDAIAIYLLRQGKLAPEFVHGQDFRLFASLEIPLGEGVSGWVAENRMPIRNGNPSVETGYLGDGAPMSGLRSALAVPLEGHNGLMGVLALYHTQPAAFSHDHLRMLLAVSYKAALSIENALRYRQAESSATTDYLTGLPNARSLFLHLESELARARRMQTPLAVLVGDLDGFKRFNDRFGHMAGNHMLRQVATVLRQNCREYDYVARMGGDEFVLVLPNIVQESAEERIRQLRELVALAAQSATGEPGLSLSAGAALYPADGTDAEQLLAEADRRMYRQKRQHPAAELTGTAELSEPGQ